MRKCLCCGGAMHGKATQAKYCSATCRVRVNDRTTRRGLCSDCGKPMGPRSKGREERCKACDKVWKRRRWPLVAALWKEGKSTLEIAGELGYTPGALSVAIARMRSAGWDVPHRHRGYD